MIVEDMYHAAYASQSYCLICLIQSKSYCLMTWNFPSWTEIVITSHIILVIIFNNSQHNKRGTRVDWVHTVIQKGTAGTTLPWSSCAIFDCYRSPSLGSEKDRGWRYPFLIFEFRHVVDRRYIHVYQITFMLLLIQLVDCCCAQARRRSQSKFLFSCSRNQGRGQMVHWYVQCPSDKAIDKYAGILHVKSL